jgi:hypothetical protein
MPLLATKRRRVTYRLTIPEAPSSLTAAVDGGKQRIDLAWADNSDNEDGFYIERSPDAGVTWTRKYTVTSNTTSYTDKKLIPGATYHYRVRAFNKAGESANTSTANDTVWDFGDVTGLILDINPDVGIFGQSGGALAREGGDCGYIEDQSGSANHFENTTAAQKPHLIAGSMNGHNVLRFDGTDDRLSATTNNFNSTSEGAMFAVYRLTPSLQDTQYIFASADTASTTRFWSCFAYEDSVDPNIRLDQNDNGTNDALRGTTTDLIADTTYIGLWRSNGTTTALRLNGTNQTIQAAAGANNGDWTGDTSARDNFVIGAMIRTGVGGFFKGDLARLIFYSAEPSAGELTSIEEALNDLYLPETRTELFIDDENIQSATTATRTINKPTKYGSNPIYVPSGANNDTWDYQKIYSSPYLLDGTYHIWSGNAEFDAPNDDQPTYSRSTDGLTWVKPILNLVSYSGDTNNNILIGLDYQFTDLYYDPDGADDRKYVMMVEHNGTLTGVYVYISADGYTFTLEKTIATWSTEGNESIEGKAIVKRDDGRWLAYYVKGHAADDREIGAFLSATDDLGGTWTKIEDGELILTSVSTSQKYGIGVEKVDNLMVSFVMYYDSTAEQTHINLMSSRSGEHFTSESTEWIPLGAATAWDDELIFNGNGLIKDGNNWHFYYCGSPVTHDTARPKDMRIGRATIGYQRIGQYGTTGNVITREILPPAGTKLYVNADASGGTLEVEVLDASDDSVTTNYAQADCDDITSDTYLTEVTWGGSPLPTGSRIKLKFYLTTDVKLYAYEVR